MNSLAAIFEDIKIQHTLFALPFAIMSAFIAAQGWPGWRLFGLILIAMFFVRSAAMAFNRLVDWRYDAGNPRTQARALPAGKATRAQYAIFVAACSIGFLATCWFINMLAFYLSFFALAIVFFYSFTKRFTAYSHFFLGLALALAPVGAWVAVREEISLVSLIIGAAVVFWLAGLDTIYSCQDYAYDTQQGLNSIPGKFGVALALRLSSIFHAVMVVLLTLAAWMAPLSWIYMTGVVFTGAMLWYEHSLVRPGDLSRVNVAFFNINGVISVGLMAFAIADVIFLG
ncbi:MAG: putative 4-hydroxybenzoate polyprenyltransferase [Nitrospinota bacterium]|nr:putative 4-hydroxybenzoate polyprenyltransferase [Nitrospinota bacterium]